MLSGATVTLKYQPRGAFTRFHSRSEKKAVLLAHRRCGKTVAAINDLVARALKIDTAKFNRPRYAYVCPELKQAKEAAWDYLKEAVLDIPGVKVSESELWVKLPGGQRIRIYGADNPASLRGGYFDGVILDEFGDMTAEIAESVLPMLDDRNGWIVYMGTPRGKNAFYDKHQEAQEEEGWFHLSLKASQTGYLAKSILEERRKSLGDELYEQEYECSFEAANVGSYFGKQIIALEAAGKLIPTRALPPGLITSREKVSIAMDIGHTDATAIWFWQVWQGSVYFIDYWEEQGYVAPEVIEVLQNKPYAYETWFVPHDARSSNFTSKRTVLEQMRAAQAPARVVPKLTIDESIEVTGVTLRTFPIYFDSERCKRGLEALRNYSRKWDIDRKTFSQQPTHDQWSHGADAFRYACQSIKAEDLARSMERWQQQVVNEQKGINSLPKPNIGRNPLTWNDHLAHHDRMQERYARANRW